MAIAALNASFGGTILYNPINTFIYCILGSKVSNLEQGLTWISQHAQLTLPTLYPNVLLLSNSSMDELVSPITAAAVGSGSSSNSSGDGVVGILFDHFESAIRVERNFYAILLGVWLAFALFGVIVVLWHSGGKDRYVAWRGPPTHQKGLAIFKSWRWKKEYPSYSYDEDKEKEFRGTSPTVPRIVETAIMTNNDNSFFDAGTARRTGTLGSTFSSLAAPGQAFLRLTGRGNSNDGQSHLVEKDVSSERYNSGIPPSPSERAETPAPIWVNKFYRAVDGARGLLPTRGQRHGEAVAMGLGRNASQRTDRSFKERPGERGDPAWTVADPRTIGRALDGDWVTDSRSHYPPVARATPIYPRPMSRATTLCEGRAIPIREVLRSPTPPALDFTRDDERAFDDAELDRGSAGGECE